MLEKFLRSIGIDKVGHYTTKNAYVVDIEDSNEYGKIYSKLDKSELVEEDEEVSTVTLHNSSVVFYSDDFQCTLIADFDSDTYKLVVKEI